MRIILCRNFVYLEFLQCLRLLTNAMKRRVRTEAAAQGVITAAQTDGGLDDCKSTF